MVERVRGEWSERERETEIKERSCSAGLQVPLISQRVLGA